jgi:plasmid stabilization system protein ParE
VSYVPPCDPNYVDVLSAVFGDFQHVDIEIAFDGLKMAQDGPEIGPSWPYNGSSRARIVTRLFRDGFQVVASKWHLQSHCMIWRSRHSAPWRQFHPQDALPHIPRSTQLPHAQKIQQLKRIHVARSFQVIMCYVHTYFTDTSSHEYFKIGARLQRRNRASLRQSCTYTGYLADSNRYVLQQQ